MIFSQRAPIRLKSRADLKTRSGNTALKTLMSNKTKSIPNLTEQMLFSSITDKKSSIDMFQSPTPQSIKHGVMFTSKRVQPRIQSFGTQNETVQLIMKYPYKDTTLYAIIQKISHNISEILQYKSEKAVVSQIEKQLDSHIRFQDIEWIFRTSRLKDWVVAEAMLKKVFQAMTYLQDGKIILKKNKPDDAWVSSLYVFGEKIDELFKKLCEESYRDFKYSLQSERVKLQGKFYQSNKKNKEKEIECMNQFANQSKKESYAHLKGIINDKFQLNFRVMNSNLVSTLTNFEDKFGNFKHIQGNNRFKSTKLNFLINDLAK